MSRLTPLRILQPVPYFPLARPLPGWARADSHEAEGVRIEHAPMLYLPRILKSLDGAWLARSVRRALPALGGARAFDLIDAHFGYPDGVGCVRVGARTGLPVFVTLRGLETDVLQDTRMGATLVDALNRATGIVSVSHSLRDLVVRHGVDAARIRVIPNAVDRARFRPTGRAEARAVLGVPSDCRLVTSVGNLIELKRHHVLIKAFARLKASLGGDLRLILIGGGEAEPQYESRLVAQTRELGVADSVRFTGRVPSDVVARWMQAADVFSLATSREGCCNSVLEALAAGLPVVTTPAGDNAHFVRDGVNGYVVPIDDVAALADALAGALRRRDWDPGAISSGLQVGSWSDVAQQVLGFFRERLAR
jgi:glycosyltransferase involved in cell wall biosynthesis